MSNSEQDWIEKYRAALQASSQTQEPGFRSVVNGVARALVAALRKLSSGCNSFSRPTAMTSKITAGKDSSSQPQKKAS